MRASILTHQQFEEPAAVCVQCLSIWGYHNQRLHAGARSSMSDLEDRGYLDESRGNADPYLEGKRRSGLVQFRHDPKFDHKH